MGLYSPSWNMAVLFKELLYWRWQLRDVDILDVVADVFVGRATAYRPSIAHSG